MDTNIVSDVLLAIDELFDSKKSTGGITLDELCDKLSYKYSSEDIRNEAYTLQKIGFINAKFIWANSEPVIGTIFNITSDGLETLDLIRR